MKAKTSILLIALATAATGCSTQIERNARKAADDIPTQLATKPLVGKADNPLGSPVSVNESSNHLNRDRLVSVSNAPWIGGITSVARRDARLPAVFEQKHVLDFGSERVSLAMVAARLTRLTSIPVRIRADVYDGEALQAKTQIIEPSVGSLLPTPLQPEGGGASPSVSTTRLSAMGDLTMSRATPSSINAVEMRWNGRLRDFLDHLTNTLSLAWEYQDGAVVIMRLVTESYQMATTPGKQTYALSSGGSGSGGGNEGGVNISSQSATNISSSGLIDAKESILKTVIQLIGSVPNSFASWSDGTGRIVVSTSKENQARVREFLDKENKALRQKVNVTFDIYSVRTKDNDEQGVDWSALFNSLNTRYGIDFRSPAQLTGTSAGSLAISTVSRDLTTSNNAIMALLSQHGQTVQHRPVSFTAAQGMWDTTGRLSTTGYLKETTPGTAGVSGSAGAPGLKTDLITTGDQYSVLPIVQSDNTTLVRFSVTLSDLISLFDVTTGSGETLQKVQTPQIEAVTKGSMITLAPGETAVITGLSRRVAKRSDNRLADGLPIFAGGSRNAEILNEHMLILVRATPL